MLSKVRLPAGDNVALSVVVEQINRLLGDIDNLVCGDLFYWEDVVWCDSQDNYGADGFSVVCASDGTPIEVA